MKTFSLLLLLGGMMLVGCARKCETVPGTVITYTVSVGSVHKDDSTAFTDYGFGQCCAEVRVPGQQKFGKRYKVTVEEIAEQP